MLLPHKNVYSVTERLREHLLVVRGLLQDSYKSHNVAVFDDYLGQHTVKEAFELFVSALLVLLVEDVEELVEVWLNDVELIAGVEASHFGVSDVH